MSNELTTNQAWQLRRLIEATGKVPKGWEELWKEIMKKTENED